MHAFTQQLTVMGEVISVDNDGLWFSVKCQSGDIFEPWIGKTTGYDVLRNLDNLSNDRVPRADDIKDVINPTPQQLLTSYIHINDLVVVQGVWQSTESGERFDARLITTLKSTKGRFLFEETHWWLTQTARLADQWLDSLFGDKRSYALDDFVQLYRTNLNVLGLPTDDVTQECAVLSRLIYGFSSAYLLTGQERYRAAAEAGVRFQRDAFRSNTHDGKYCFWAFGRRHGKYGSQLLVPSQSGCDAGSFALYEQIYALAGMTQYYRISLDPEVRDDIARTMATFNAFFLDNRTDEPFANKDGWFSHIDYATLRPDRNPIADNNLKKNWNSVGDHIPAYLINLILALDPLPLAEDPGLAPLLETARDMLLRATNLILDKFFDKNSPFVDERFDANWIPDHHYFWQQNRAIVGHNYKISWNLTRVANYCYTVAEARCSDPDQGTGWRDVADRCIKKAVELGSAMTEVGLDKIRGGCFDGLERNPEKDLLVDFAWSNHKDFWQQEQAILAYLIMYGHVQDEGQFLNMAQRTEAFWNLFFLDRDHHGIFFRVTENGLPILDTDHGVRGGHSDASGYHCFELAYLAHVYNRFYVAPKVGGDGAVCMYFRPDPACKQNSINVLPDFVPPGRVRVTRVTVGTVPRPVLDPYCYQVPLSLDDWGKTVKVELVAE